MTAPDQVLTDLLAAALYTALAKAAKSGTATVDDLLACLIPAVEQHTQTHTARIAEARQWDGTRASIEALARWANAGDDLMDDFTLEYSFTTGTNVFDVSIATESDYEVVNPGDWIIRDTSGEFHLCRAVDTAGQYVRAALEGEQR